MKLLVISSPYLISSATLHFNFYIYFIYLNKSYAILNSEMSMASGELETMLAIKFLEKRLISSYSMIIAKVFESAFESCYASTKLKVLYN